MDDKKPIERLDPETGLPQHHESARSGWWVHQQLDSATTDKDRAARRETINVYQYRIDKDMRSFFSSPEFAAIPLEERQIKVAEERHKLEGNASLALKDLIRQQQERELFDKAQENRAIGRKEREEPERER